MFNSNFTSISDKWNSFLEILKVEIDQVVNDVQYLSAHNRKFKRISNDLFNFSKNLSHFVADKRQITSSELTVFQSLSSHLSNFSSLQEKYTNSKIQNTLISDSIFSEKGDISTTLSQIIQFKSLFNQQTKLLGMPEIQTDLSLLRNDDRLDIQSLALLCRRFNISFPLVSTREEINDIDQLVAQKLEMFKKIFVRKEDLEINFNYKINSTNSKFSYVYSGTLNSTTEKVVAVEILNSSYLIQQEFDYFTEKVNLLGSLDHFSIIPLVGVQISSKPYYNITEFNPKRSLFNMIHNMTYQKIDQSKKTIIALGIAQGMNYLHSMKNIVHTELKTSDIFLDPDGFPKIRCGSSAKHAGAIFKINDKKNSNSETVDTNDDFFSVWTAPELMANSSSEKVVINKKMDVYSFGILLWELLTNDLAFNGLSHQQMIHEIVEDGRRPLIPQNCPTNLSKLIQSCWAKDPSKRPDFSQIVDLFEKGYVYFPGNDRDDLNNYKNNILKKYENITLKIEVVTKTKHENVCSLVSHFMKCGSTQSIEFVNDLYEMLKKKENNEHYAFNETVLNRFSTFFISTSLNARQSASKLLSYINQKKLVDNESSIASILPNLILAITDVISENTTLPLLSLLNELLENPTCCLQLDKIEACSSLFTLCFCPNEKISLSTMDFFIGFLKKFMASNSLIVLFLKKFIDFDSKNPELCIRLLKILFLLAENEKLFTLFSFNFQAIEKLKFFLEHESENVVIAALKLLFTLVSGSTSNDLPFVNFKYITNYAKIADKVFNLVLSENYSISSLSCCVTARIVSFLKDEKSFSSFLSKDVLQKLCFDDKDNDDDSSNKNDYKTNKDNKKDKKYNSDKNDNQNKGNSILNYNNSSDNSSNDSNSDSSNDSSESEGETSDKSSGNNNFNSNEKCRLNIYSLRLFGALSTTYIGSQYNLCILDKIYLKMFINGTEKEKEMAASVLESQSSQTPSNEVLLDAIPSFFDYFEKCEQKSTQNLGGILVFFANVCIDPIGAVRCFDLIPKFLNKMNIYLVGTDQGNVLMSIILRILSTFEVKEKLKENEEIITNVLGKTRNLWYTTLFENVFELYEILSTFKEGIKALKKDEVDEKLKRYLKQEDKSLNSTRLRSLGKRTLIRLEQKQ